LRGKENGLYDILDITQTDMSFLTQEAGLDPFGEELEEGIHIPISWPIDSGGAENDKRQFVNMGKGEVLSHPFALAIG
jgi:hypothetical protein